MRNSLMTYVLMALLSICSVSILFIAIWPILGLIVDGFHLVGLLLTGGK